MIIYFAFFFFLVYHRSICFNIKIFYTSLMVQWLRIHLPMQGTQIWSLVRGDPTCRGATKPGCHNCWAGALEPELHNKNHCNILQTWREEFNLLRYGRKHVWGAFFTAGLHMEWVQMTQTARLKWLLQRSPRLALSLCKDIPPPQALRWDWSIGKLRDCHEKPKIFKKPSRVCSVWNEVVFILQQLLRWPPEVPIGQ